MARIDTLPHFLTDVADAIREKKGSEDTIQASDFDTEIENLPSGGSNPPKNLIELSDQFISLIHSIVDGLKEVPKSYTTKTNVPIVLYTPNEDFQYYIIQKRSSGNYRVVWFDEPCIMWFNGIYAFSFFVQDRSFNTIEGVETFETNIFTPNSNANIGTFYISPEQTTVDQCIDKVMNNQLTYNRVTGYLAAVTDSQYVVSYTNCAVLKSDGTLAETQRLSSNETIEVMQ